MKRFKQELTGLTNRPVKLSCQLNYGGAKLKWMKDGKPISVSPKQLTNIFLFYIVLFNECFFAQMADSRYQVLMEDDRTQLTIKKCKLEDAGIFSCEIQQFVKDGEDSEIVCNLSVEGKMNDPHLP